MSISWIKIIELAKATYYCPNVSIVYWILLTVASVKRSFSKLKLLENYLRSLISQEMLKGLAIICIEKYTKEHVVVDIIISDFASRNTRMKCFVWAFEY